MGLIQFLTEKKIADHDAAAKAEAMRILETVFDRERWEIEIDVNSYTQDNVANLWNNEIRRPLRDALEAAGRNQSDFGQWLGEVHYVNIRIAPKRIFERSRSNQGWRISVMALPAAEVIALGIASHYQGGQNHNALGNASGFLNDVAVDGLPETTSGLPGRKVTAADWDRSGLFEVPVLEVDGIKIPNSSDDGQLTLKSVRTTTVKKILASYIAIEAVNPKIDEEQFLQLLRKWESVGWVLATQVPPFTSVHDFEPLRALALQDIAAANLRLQLRRRSATRSTVRIYYGPPGTGKTLTAVRDAVRLVDPSFSDNGDPSSSFGKFNELTDQVSFITFHQALQYEDAIESIRPSVDSNEQYKADPDDSDEGDDSLSEGFRLSTQNKIGYKLHEGVILRAIRSALQNPSKEYVVVIDEINRGDISRILGPLISALEPDKRLGAEYPISIELQYPRAENIETRLFLPANLHFLGTMNSADRNIALVDHALRRRFEFVWVPPEPDLLTTTSDAVSIDLKRLMIALNTRLTHLLGHEYSIGHGYFMGCKTNEDVIRVLARKVIPLLEEYFFGNQGLMLLVLGEQLNENYNIHLISEPTTAFEAIFNMSKESAGSLGYRPHEAGLSISVDPRFWDNSKGIPGPGDNDYAIQSVLKIYAPTKSSVDGE